MSQISGTSSLRFSPHDLRRTARSNAKRLAVDYETAEYMLNQVKKDLARTYGLHELEEEKRQWFLKWEEEIMHIAERAGVAEALGAPIKDNKKGYSFSINLPRSTRIQPPLDLRSAKPGAVAKLTQPATKFEFTWEPRRPSFPETVDLPTRQSRQQRKFFDGD